MHIFKITIISLLLSTSCEAMQQPSQSLGWWQKLMRNFTTSTPTTEPVAASVSPAKPSWWERIQNFFYPALRRQSRSLHPLIEIITPAKKTYFIPLPLIEQSPYLNSKVIPAMYDQQGQPVQKQIKLTPADIINENTLAQLMILIRKYFELGPASINELKQFVKNNKQLNNNILNLFKQTVKWELTRLSQVLGLIIIDSLLLQKNPSIQFISLYEISTPIRPSRPQILNSLSLHEQVMLMSFVPWTREIYQTMGKEILVPLLKEWSNYNQVLNPLLDNFLNFLLSLPRNEETSTFIKTLDNHVSRLLTDYSMHHRLPFLRENTLPITAPTASLDFNPQGTQLIQGTVDGNLLFTHLSTFKQHLKQIPHTDTPITFLKYCSSESILLATNKQIISLNPQNNQELLLAHLPANPTITVSSDNNLIGIASNEGHIQIIDIQQKQNNPLAQPGRPFQLIQRFYSITFDHSISPNVILGSQGYIQVWNPYTQQNIVELKENHNKPITALTIFNNALISGSYNKISVWDLETKKAKYTISLSIGDITALATVVWNDKPYILAGGSQGNILIISLETGKIIENIHQEGTIKTIVPYPQRIAFAAIVGEQAFVWKLIQEVAKRPLTLHELITVLHT